MRCNGLACVARREMLIGFLAEPALLMVLFSASLISQSTSLTTIVETLVHRELTIYPGLAFAGVAFTMVSLAENARVPVDNPATHLELTMIHEALILEYSGRHLALLEWAASLKLFAIPPSRATAMVGVARPADAVTLLARAKQACAGGVEAFELMGRMGITFALKHIPGLREPLLGAHPWYVLIEAIGSEPGGAEAALERLLAQALEDGLAQDAVIAQSQAQAKAFWRLREDQSAAQKPEGLSWKHDVSVPVSKVAELIERTGAEIGRRWPRVRIAAFGHVGDGNIHYNISEPEGGDPAFEADREACARVVHDIVDALGGSISAEHGLGVMKSDEALRYKSAFEVETMRAVRRALDPKRIMNPRVLF